MKGKYTSLLLLLSLVLLTQSEMTPIVQSNLWSRLLTKGAAIGLATYHNIYHANMLGPGTFWLCSSPELMPGRTLTYEHTFYASCTSPATFQATADQSFRAYFDGRLILSGNDWRSVYSVDVKLNCGPHNLTIEATGGSDQYGPGVIFQLRQDQSDCFSCGLNSYWDNEQCKCKCISICGCASPQKWFNYPACSCRCPTASVIGNAATQVAYYSMLRDQFKGQLMDPSCPSGQLFDQRSCQCRCLPQFCPQRWRWNSDPEICRCQFIP